MDENQCRACLGEASDSRFSLFKRVNGVELQEQLEFVTTVKVSSFIRFVYKKFMFVF